MAKQKLSLLSFYIDPTLKAELDELGGGNEDNSPRLQELVSDILAEEIEDYTPEGIPTPVYLGKARISFAVRVAPETKEAIAAIAKAESRKKWVIADRMLRHGLAKLKGNGIKSSDINQKKEFAKLKKTIKNLTKKQREVLDAIACGDDSGHNQATIRALSNKGLITNYWDENMAPHRGPRFLGEYRYELPTWVHLAWAEVCSDEIDKEELNDNRST